MKYLLFFFFLTSFSLQGIASINYTPEDSLIVDRYLQLMQPKRNLPVNQLVIETSRFLLGTPYVASTLEKEPEQLVVNLRELDCTTFVENCLALSLTLKALHPDFAIYCKKLQSLRYRNGEITDYVSRLHYTTDWIAENEKSNLLKDITKEIGGKLLPVEVSFMTTHPDKYKQLATHPPLISALSVVEKENNNRTHYYIPKTEIPSVSKLIRDGDIICFTTSIKGLDVTHVGYAFWQNGQLTFIHASTSANKVVINPVSLADYCRGIRNNTGIIVVRIR